MRLLLIGQMAKEARMRRWFVCVCVCVCVKEWDDVPNTWTNDEKKANTVDNE